MQVVVQETPHRIVAELAFEVGQRMPGTIQLGVADAVVVEPLVPDKRNGTELPVACHAGSPRNRSSTSVSRSGCSSAR